MCCRLFALVVVTITLGMISACDWPSSRNTSETRALTATASVQSTASSARPLSGSRAPQSVAGGRPAPTSLQTEVVSQPPEPATSPAEPEPQVLDARNGRFQEGDLVIELTSAESRFSNPVRGRSENWFETNWTIRNRSTNARQDLAELLVRLRKAELVDSQGQSVGRVDAFFISTDGSRTPGVPTLFPGTSATARVNFAEPTTSGLTIYLSAQDPRSSIRFPISRR